MAVGINAKASIDATDFNKNLKLMTAKSKALDAEMKALTASFDKDGKSQKDNAKKRELANKQIEAQKEKAELLAQKIALLEKEGKGETAECYNLRKQLADTNAAIANYSKETEKAGKETGVSTGQLVKAGAALGAMKLAAKAVAGAIKGIASAAVSAAKGVWNLAKGQGEWADELITTSNTSGVDVELLQEWGYAARFIDVEVSTMTKGMRKLDTVWNKGARSKKKSVKIAKGVTVSLKGENGQLKDQTEFFYDCIDALHGMTSESQRNEAASKLFGKQWRDMLPLIEAGTDGLRAYGEEAHEVGAIIGEENVYALGAFDDQMQKLDAQFSALKTNIALAFLPLMETVAERLSGFMGVVTNAIADGLQEEDIDTIVDAFFGMFEPAMSDDDKQNMNAIEFIGKLISALLEQLGVNKEKILEIGSTVMGYVGEGIANGLSTLWSEFWTALNEYDGTNDPIDKWISDQIETYLTPLVTEWCVKAWNWGYNLFDNLGKGILNAWETVKTTVSTVGTNLLTAVGGWVTSAYEKGKSFITDFVNGISDAWTTAVTTVSTVGTELLTTVGGWITSVYESGKKFLSSFVGGIVSEWSQKIQTIKGIGTELMQKFTGWVEDAKTWGKDLIKNFVSGIKSKWTDLKEGISGVGNAIKRRLGFSEPKEGPLSDFHTYAPDMIDLFVKGIKDNSYKIDNALNRTFGVLPSTDPTAVNGARTTNYGGVSINVYGAAGQDVNQLADIVMQRMQNAVNRREAVFA